MAAPPQNVKPGLSQVCPLDRGGENSDEMSVCRRLALADISQRPGWI
jgi:hypothetical protein